jgi:hypothetical protein
MPLNHLALTTILPLQPALPEWGTYKRLITLALLLLAAGNSYGLACTGILVSIFGLALIYDQVVLQGLLQSLIHKP